MLVTVVYLGLGTNIGDRARNLAEALRRLRGFLTLDALSSVYATEPLGFADQPEFWNMVVRAHTSFAPAELLERTRAVEREMGRTRSFRDAPRVIDIDILLYGTGPVSAPGLEVPHARMLDRAFVLRPLAELDPELRHPVTGVSLAERAAAPGLGRVERLFSADQLLPRGDDADV